MAVLQMQPSFRLPSSFQLPLGIRSSIEEIFKTAIERIYKPISIDSDISIHIEDPEKLLSDAERAYENLEYEDALKIIVKLLRSPDLSEIQQARAYLYLGLALTALGRAENAVQSFMEVLKIRPEFRIPAGVSPSIVAMFNIALNHLNLYGNNVNFDERDEGQSDLVDRVESPLNKDPVDKLLNKAERAYECLEYEKALAILNKLVQSPDLSKIQQARAYLYLGVSYTALGRAENAVQSFIEVLKIIPEFRIPAGVSPSIDAMFNQALQCLEITSETVMSDEVDEEKPDTLDSVQLASSKEQSRQPEQIESRNVYPKERDAEQVGNLGGFELENSLKQLFHLGHIESGAAERLLRKVERLYESREYERSLNVLSKVQQIPELDDLYRARTHLYRALVFASLRRPEHATSEFFKVLQIRPEIRISNPIHPYLRSLFLKALKGLNLPSRSSIDDHIIFSDIIDENDICRATGALFVRATHLFEILDYEGALEVAESILQLQTPSDSECANAHFYIALALTALKSPDDALKEFTKVLSLQPDFRLPSGMPPTLVLIFQKALRKQESKTDLQIMDNAWESYRVGEYNIAITLAQKIIDSNRNNQQAWSIVGASAIYLNRLVLAQKAYGQLDSDRRQLLRRIADRVGIKFNADESENNEKSK